MRTPEIQGFFLFLRGGGLFFCLGSGGLGRATEQAFEREEAGDGFVLGHYLFF